MTPDITPEMTCAACRERLVAYTANHLDSDERAAVERHLAGCVACRREAAFWGALGTALAAQESDIPPDTRSADGWLALRARLPRHDATFATHTRKAPVLDVDVVAHDPLARPPYPPQRSRRRPWPALVAAALLVALVAALFGLFGAHLRTGNGATPAGVATSTPAACSTSTLRATLPPHAFVSSISMTSPRDGWAVGWIQDGAGQQSVAPKSLILKFSNCQWQPFGESIAAAQLFSVSMGSATDGWAVGATVQDAGDPQASGSATHDWLAGTLFALHYTNGEWQRVALPGVTGGASGKVRMISASEGWMLLDIGKRHTDPYTVKYTYALLHYQHGSWSQTPLTFDTSGTLLLWDIAAMTPDDCWIVGYGAASDHVAVAHYHQGAWRTWSGAQLGVAYPALYAVTMTGPDDVWVAGSYPYQDASGDHTGPLALRYDGATWTRQAIGDSPDAHSSNGGDLMTLAATSPTEVWAFPNGFAGLPGEYQMARYHAGAWSWVALPGGLVSINTATFTANSTGFAAAMKLTPAGMETTLLSYDDGTWSVIPSR